MSQIEKPSTQNMINTFRQRTEGLDRWIEDTQDCPCLLIAASRHDGNEDTNTSTPRDVLIHQLSVAPFLFYRFSNGARLWNVIEEDFRAFGATEVWQEDNPYPKPGDMSRWMQSL